MVEFFELTNQPLLKNGACGTSDNLWGLVNEPSLYPSLPSILYGRSDRDPDSSPKEVCPALSCGGYGILCILQQPKANVGFLRS
jgi:hypothetical protein